MAQDDGPMVLALLNEAFGRQKPWSWFEWKHMRGPWGPSTGWLATQGGRVAAARLFLPWEVQGPVGLGAVPIARAVDGAVAPWARRRGLFSKCVVAEMEAISSGHRKARLLHSTSVPASREAYRKLGWTIWEEAHRIRPVLSMRGVAPIVWEDTDDPQLEGMEVNRIEGSTCWDADSIRWRIRRESGHEYRIATLRESNSPQGLIARRTKIQGIPALVVAHSWGEQREVSALVSAAAAQWRCLLVLEVQGTGKPTRSIKAGGSTISAWTAPDATGTGPRLLRRLKFDFADLEGVM